MRGAAVRAIGAAMMQGMVGIALLAGRAAAQRHPTATAVFAGGCYWGMDAVFRHLAGVSEVTSGFAVPIPPSSGADSVAGHAGYAEAVRVVYDPGQITYARLLEIFFLVAHDPTEIDRQGPDVGPQYRSIVFVDDPVQMRSVRSYIDHLTESKAYPRPIVTTVTRLLSFHEAPPDQQNYAAAHEGEPYIIINDVPKLDRLKRQYPRLYKE